MLMSLGLFVFERATMLPDELQRSTSWNHASSDRVGARPAYQFLGPGEETITIPGKLVPELGGRLGAIDTLREMAATGEDHQLVEGTGLVFGSFRITQLDDTRRSLIDNGAPRIVDFTLSLVRTD